MAAILLVDDEPAIRDMLKSVLKLSGHLPLEASGAGQTREIMQTQKPDIALVDIMMPGEDGFSLAKDLIASGIPVLFLTARTAVADRVRGLRMGAEDYVLKPFEPEELLARIDVILRRTQPKVFEENGIQIDYSARTVVINNSPVTLTATEFELLALLTRNAGAALSRDKILSTVWGWDYIGETRTVDVHVQRLRAKLGTNNIETVYKYGYRWISGGDAQP
jgi:DNA-binding response OmpR family regulator